MEYIQLVQRPELIPQTDVKTIQNWVNDYPYVPIYRVLLAAKYQSENHPETAKFLEQAAFYVPDRKKLKQLLRNLTEVQEKYASEALAPDTTLENNIEPISEEITDNPFRESVQEIENVEIEKNDLNAPKDDISSAVEKDVPNKIVATTVETITATPSIEEAISTDEDKQDEIAETPDIPSPTEEIVTIEEKAEGISEEDDIEFLQKINLYDSPNSTQKRISPEVLWELETPGNSLHELSKEDTIETGFVQTDITWLLPWIEEFESTRKNPNDISLPKNTKGSTNQSSKSESIENKEITEAKIQTQESVKNEHVDLNNKKEQFYSNHSFDEWLSILEQKKNSPGSAPIFDPPSTEIFEVNESVPEISDINIPSKEEETPPENISVKDIAADSISYKMEMATETLAKLYEKQGKMEMAIQVYHQLKEKFPKKSTYFASQIKRLKK